jgi:hypothetical protein
MDLNSKLASLHLFFIKEYQLAELFKNRLPLTVKLVQQIQAVLKNLRVPL